MEVLQGRSTAAATPPTGFTVCTLGGSHLEERRPMPRVLWWLQGGFGSGSKAKGALRSAVVTKVPMSINPSPFNGNN